MKPVNKEDLDAYALAGCGNPGCTESTHTFWLHPKCHVHGGLTASYTHNSSELHIFCRLCSRLVAVIAVEGGK